MSATATTVPPEMAQAARQWQAEEQLEANKAAEPIRQLEAQQAEANAPKAPDANLVQLSAGLWQVLDRLVVGLAGAELALTTEERQQLAGPTAAVVEKYMPEVLQRITSTPEGVLLGTIAMIYAPKAGALLMAPAPVAAPEPAPSPAPEVQA